MGVKIAQRFAGVTLGRTLARERVGRVNHPLRHFPSVETFSLPLSWIYLFYFKYLHVGFLHAHPEFQHIALIARGLTKAISL